MEKEVKTILIVAGIIAGVAAITLTIYFVVKQKEKSNDAESNEINPYASSQDKITTPSPVPTTTDTSNYLIAPTFNTEGELSNSIQQLKGRTIYPKTKAEGGADYSNIRSSAEVNTSQGWWDKDNQIATIYVGTPIGTVISDTTTIYNSYPYRWFKVRLQQPVSTFFSSITEAFVRADTVTFKPVK